MERNVWIFPIKPVPDNDVVKPDLFVFCDMDDYRKNGKNIDAKYVKQMQKTKSNHKKSISKGNGFKGKKVKHKDYGIGTVIKYDGIVITVKFSGVGTKTFQYKMCVENNFIEFI